MANIYQLPTPLVGTTQVAPNFKFMVTGDNLATVTTAGYLNSVNLEGYPISSTDVIQAIIGFNPALQTGDYAIFTVSISSAGVITLNNFGSSEGGVVLPTTTSRIATYGNTTGQLTQNATTAVNGGSIQAIGNVFAGQAGTAGQFICFPPTTNNGNFSLRATNSTANATSTITNGNVTAASLYTLPIITGGDGLNAYLAVAPVGVPVTGQVATFNGTGGSLAAAGFTLHGGQTAAYGGGATSNIFTGLTNITGTSIVTASNFSSTNSVSITKVTPGDGTLTVTWSADPGLATIVTYIALSAAG